MTRGVQPRNASILKLLSKEQQAVNEFWKTHDNGSKLNDVAVLAGLAGDAPKLLRKAAGDAEDFTGLRGACEILNEKSYAS